MKWYFDKKAGLIKDEEQVGYICRGFRQEHGNLLAAAPELLEACKAAMEVLEEIDEIPFGIGARKAVQKAMNGGQILEQLKAIIEKAQA